MDSVIFLFIKKILLIIVVFLTFKNKNKNIIKQDLKNKNSFDTEFSLEIRETKLIN